MLEFGLSWWLGVFLVWYFVVRFGRCCFGYALCNFSGWLWIMSWYCQGVYLDAVFSGFTGALAQLRVLGFWFNSYFVVWSSCVGACLC